MKKIKITLIIVLIGLFTIPNFFDELSNNGTLYGANDFTQVVNTPTEIKTIMETACFDCHSNQTNYMWYSGIAPLSLILNHDIEEGKHELNFSEFKTYKAKRQKHKLEEIAEQVESHEMPMTAYTWTHPQAKLTDDQRTLLINWAKAAMEEINLADTTVKVETKEVSVKEPRH
ncbi:MAG: heme-binding domain-containing protein [Bacteroidia bacterium]